jgi:hypothetical protein
LGDIIAHNVVREGAKFDVVSASWDTLSSRLNSDVDCLTWLGGGTRGGYAVDPTLRADVGTRIGVADRFEQGGNQANGIAAMANMSPDWDIVVKGAGAFLYGVIFPGLGIELSAKSENGQILLLLHELAHVAGRLVASDVDPALNARNNAAVLENCARTVLGN